MRVMRAILPSIFFLLLVQGLADHQSFRGPPSLSYRSKPPRHLQSGDDPGDDYKRDNLAPRVFSLPGKLILNSATKLPKIETFPEKSQSRFGCLLVRQM